MLITDRDEFLNFKGHRNGIFKNQRRKLEDFEQVHFKGISLFLI